MVVCFVDFEIFVQGDNFEWYFMVKDFYLFVWGVVNEDVVGVDCFVVEGEYCQVCVFGGFVFEIQICDGCIVIEVFVFFIQYVIGLEFIEY